MKRKKVRDGWLILGWAVLGLALASACATPSSGSAADGERGPVAAENGGEPDTGGVAAASQKAGDPQAQEWLWRIAQKHAGVGTLEAKLTYDRIQGILGDTQRRLGRLVYRLGPPAKFAVHFDRLLVDERLLEQDRWYVFDGRWLVERLTTERQFLAYEVVAPDAPAMDPLAVGQGPFVVPIGPDPQRVLERFEVAVVAGEEGPAGTVHLRLTPRSDRASDFTQIDVWYDQQTLLPVRVWTADESENESHVVLGEVKVNVVVDEEVFDTQPPKERGWDVRISAWQDKDGGGQR